MLGGADESDAAPDTTTTATSSVTGATTASPSRVRIAPGQRYIFTRYLVVSDADFTRVARKAYHEHNITSGTIVGVVLEEGTYRRLAGAQVRISGGPDWQPPASAKAFTRVMTGTDGVFVAHVPPGKYVVTPYMIGRVPMGQTVLTEVAVGAPRNLPLLLSKPSGVRIGVSDAETATSTPLPSRVMIIAKPGTPPVDFGFGPDLLNGVRNIFYMPRGGAEIPLDPGRYQVMISRGTEYDVVQQDVTVVPNSPPSEILVSLPHAVKPPAGMIAFDIGVMTSASIVSPVSARDRIVMAMCEGVPVIVSGDFDTATNLQAEIERLGAQNRVRAFQGMRFLVSKGGLTANVLVYPVDASIAARLTAFRLRVGDVPPDVFLADLRREFPDVIVQIDEPLHPDRGYLTKFEFNETTNTFVGGAMPPPDFDALQILEGSKTGLTEPTFARFRDLATARTRIPGGARPLTPVGSSNSKLPYGEEVGSPRMYIRTSRDTLDRVTTGDLVRAIRGQHIMVTNGPFTLFWALDPASGQFNRMPGDTLDIHTTQILRTKTNILAPSWVSVSGFQVVTNNLPAAIREMMPKPDVLRFPVHKLPDADVQTIYLQQDALVSPFVFSSRRSLAPLVPENPPELGGPAYPRAWTGPIFVDKDGDGKVTAVPIGVSLPGQ